MSIQFILQFNNLHEFPKLYSVCIDIQFGPLNIALHWLTTHTAILITIFLYIRIYCYYNSFTVNIFTLLISIFSTKETCISLSVFTNVCHQNYHFQMLLRKLLKLHLSFRICTKRRLYTAQ
jgi:hypothetical protein